MQAPDHLFPINQENRVLFRQFRTKHAVQHPFHRGELPFPFRRINNKASFAQRPEQMEPRISRNRLQAAAVLDGHGPGPFHQSGRPGHIIFTRTGWAAGRAASMPTPKIAATSRQMPARRKCFFPPGAEAACGSAVAAVPADARPGLRRRYLPKHRQNATAIL